MDIALGDLNAPDFKITPANEAAIRRSTADGIFGNHPDRVRYYFGNLEPRRLTWSRGRDVTLSPRQNGGPVNALFEAYIEVDGKPLLEGPDGWLRKVTFRERHGSN